MTKIFKAFAILVVAFFLTAGCISLVNAAERDVDVPVQMLDGTVNTLTFTGVPDHVQIPVCQQSSANLIVCAVVDGDQVKPLFIQINPEEV